ncbi:hypothetical protein ACQU0X_26880 [Pseudovibrio ascidiaceicola]|uniref:hypothetical protein n=1 Tax=Pseudovibrio ascidiaceicola TaxID=285279 RepID=UPI003D36CA5A
MRLTIALSALSALLLASAAQAAPTPLDFRSEPQAYGRQIVDKYFASFLKVRTGAKVGVAVADADDDGVGEVFARFEHSSSCAKRNKCRTVVLSHKRGKWTLVFDRYVSDLKLGEEGPTGVKSLLADGMNWNWRVGSYWPDAAPLGKDIQFSALPDKNKAGIAPAFGSGAKSLIAGKKLNVELASLEAAKPLRLLRLSSDAGCGFTQGCSYRALSHDGEQWGVVLSAIARDVQELPTKVGGYPDLLFSSTRGYYVLRWNKNKYVMADQIEVAR